MVKRRVGRPRKSSSRKSVKKYTGKIKNVGRVSKTKFTGRPKVGFVGGMGTYSQTGSRKSVKADRARKALRPGNRISKSGNLYFENRKNRSDKKGSRL